jgi:hypothetical protein
MLPRTPVMVGGDWRAQGCGLSHLLRSAASEGEQALGVLARRDQ